MLILAVVSAAAAIGTAGVRAGELEYEPVWSDEFDGTAVDSANWEFQIGDGCPGLCGWGNNELQYYRAENATVAGGLLTITAKQESFMGYSYTSSRMRTINLGDWTYGRIEMRARMPIGQGIWPALWMLPTAGAYGGWAASGEIDILEYVGHEPDEIFGTLHYGGPFPANASSSQGFTLSTGTFNDAFHDFALEWGPHEMRWFVDGALYACQSHWYSTAGTYPAPFDQDFHLLLNMAVGGNLPGPPDMTTMFPQQYVVDHIRVLQRPEFPQCESLFAGLDHANPFGNGWFAFNGGGGGGIGANTTDLSAEGCNASLSAGWGSGGTPGYFGGFGRNFPTDLSDRTHFTFWVNPDAGQDYTIEVNLQDDDDGDDAIASSPDGADDEFQFDCLVTAFGPCAITGGGWQRVSIPLADFFDDNSYHFGGNGVLDPVPTTKGGNGQLVNVVFTLISTAGSDVNFRTDKWQFTREDGSIAGRVWDDADGDGVADGGEFGLNGVDVDLLDSGAAVVGTTTTAGDGQYSFPSLPWDEYTVSIGTNSLPAGTSPTADPDGLSTPHAAARLLGCADSEPAYDFGYGPVPSPTTPTMTVAKNGADPSQLDITYDTATCNASDHSLFFGAAGDFSTVTDASCSVGGSGSVTVTPPAGDVWLLLAGREGARYSSAGQSTAGERALAGIGIECPALLSQDLSGTCP